MQFIDEEGWVGCLFVFDAECCNPWTNGDWCSVVLKESGFKRSPMKGEEQDRFIYYSLILPAILGDRIDTCSIKVQLVLKGVVL